MTDTVPAPEEGTQPDAAPETTPAPEPATNEPTAPETPPPASPWAGDLESRFEDESVRGAVDQFLREQVQPYVTKLEQESQPERYASRLYKDFKENPLETYISVTEELFGQERVDAIRAVIAGDDVPTGDAVSDDNEYFDLDELPPEVREAVEFVQNNKRESAWEETLKQVQEDHADIKIREDLFVPFVNAADGDVDLAIEGYKQFLEEAKQEFGLNVPSPDDVPDTAPAPPVVGQDGETATVPPHSTTPETLDDAIDELWKEMQDTPAPTTVGST